MNGFESISKLESYALNHLIYSTSFNKLVDGNFDLKRRRIVFVLLAFNWLLIILIFSKIIPFITNVVPSYKIDFFSLIKEDRNSYVIMTTAYLTAICYMKTDFLINESSSPILFDLNLLKNGYTNRLTKSNLEIMKIQSGFLYQIVKFVSPLAKIVFTSYFSIYFIMILCNFNDAFKITFSIALYFFWIIGLQHAIDLTNVYGTIIILGINYLRLRYDQINEKFLMIYNDKKKFQCKKLLKIISEHKSIERKTQLYNSRINRSLACCFIGLTIGMVANLYIMTFSNDSIHRIFSILTGSAILLFELIIMFEMVALTDSAHYSFPILNSILIKKKIDLKSKLRV